MNISLSEIQNLRVAFSVDIEMSDVCFLFNAYGHCKRGSICTVAEDNTPYCKYETLFNSALGFKILRL